jgi:large subunit ribosomal protein L6
MSRIGLKPIIIPEGVTITVKDKVVTVSKGEKSLTQALPQEVKVVVSENEVKVSVLKQDKTTKALHGLIRSLINNMVLGLTEGFSKTLELQGTGFRVNPKQDLPAGRQGIELALGFSHPVVYTPPVGITLEVKDQKLIIVSGIDKQLVGQVAANIREFKKPDAYKGKGIRFQGESIKLKPGKAAKAAGE